MLGCERLRSPRIPRGPKIFTLSSECAGSIVAAVDNTRERPKFRPAWNAFYPTYSGMHCPLSSEREPLLSTSGR